MTIYGICCALGLAAALVIAWFYLRRKHVAYGVWIRLCVAAIPLSLLLSRVLYSLWGVINGEFPLRYALHFTHGGASLTGAIAGAALAALIVGKLTKTSVGTLLDSLAVGAPAAIVIVRLAEFGSEIIGRGREVDTPWLTWLGQWTDDCHPVFLYEAVMAAVILIVVYRFAMRKIRREGDAMLTFLALYGSSQMFFESLRDDMHMVIYFIRFNQIFGLVMVLIAFTLWMIRWKKTGVKGKQLILPIVVMIAAIVLGIYQEFQVDSNPNLLKEYAIMAAAVAAMGAQTILIRNRSVKE